MTYNTLTNFTNASGSNGLDQTFLYVTSIVPSFVPLMLFAVWIISSIGTYFGQTAIKGEGNFWGCLAVGSWFTLIVAFIMSLVPNLVTGYTMGICFIVSIVTSIIFLTQGDRSI
jgi:hypothetical protein